MWLMRPCIVQIDAKARERERMVDLVGALEDGEGLSELLAPKTCVCR